MSSQHKVTSFLSTEGHDFLQEDSRVESPCPVLCQPSDGSSGGVQVSWQQPSKGYCGTATLNLHMRGDHDSESELGADSELRADYL